MHDYIINSSYFSGIIFTGLLLPFTKIESQINLLQTIWLKNGLRDPLLRVLGQVQQHHPAMHTEEFRRAEGSVAVTVGISDMGQ